MRDNELMARDSILAIYFHISNRKIWNLYEIALPAFYGLTSLDNIWKMHDCIITCFSGSYTAATLSKELISRNSLNFYYFVP